MKKYIMDFTVSSATHLNGRYTLLKLTHSEPLPEMLPGQFVEVRVDGSDRVMLRRPISINFVDRENNEIWLLIAMIGNGTRQLGLLRKGDSLNCVLPLGNGFTISQQTGHRTLLVGGGVGVAPLLYMGAEMLRRQLEPTFLLGARTKDDLLELSEFQRLGRVVVTTEDGSMGQQGFVTSHTIWDEEQFDSVATCGPKPMMQAVARRAAEKGTVCEASLENMMACGLGACLCCVEKTREGNLCVCKEGPVFNTERLLWQI